MKTNSLTDTLDRIIKEVDFDIEDNEEILEFYKEHPERKDEANLFKKKHSALKRKKKNLLKIREIVTAKEEQEENCLTIAGLFNKYGTSAAKDGIYDTIILKGKGELVIKDSTDGGILDCITFIPAAFDGEEDCLETKYCTYMLHNASLIAHGAHHLEIVLGDGDKISFDF